MKRLSIIAVAAACLLAGCGDPTGDKRDDVYTLTDRIHDGQIEKACDGPNMLYLDHWHSSIAVVKDDPRCGR